MNVESAIRSSEWWRQAVEMPDRHYDLSAGVSLADHLEAVLRNLQSLHQAGERHEYFSQLNQALAGAGLVLLDAVNLLTPVALLHDIGKTKEDKSDEGEHPITGKAVKMRHPIVSVFAALELLPGGLDRRNTILALIEEHDTPYSWYMQFQKTGQIPKRKSWLRLDRKIDSREDGTGLVLLSLFKLVDVDGHENVDDVTWFFEQAYINYLREKGKWLPVPDQAVIQSLKKMTG
jgi:hypothetical protein